MRCRKRTREGGGNFVRLHFFVFSAYDADDTSISKCIDMLSVVGSAKSSWSWGPANSRAVRLLLYGQYGIFGGLLFLLLLGFAYLLVRNVLSRELSLLLVLGLFTVNWFAARTAIIERAGLTTLRQTRLYDEFFQVAHQRWYATATLLCAGAHYLLFTYSPIVWALGFSVSVPVALIGPQFLSSEGELDRDAQTLTYQSRDVDLRLVTDVRRFTMGERTVLWLSFTHGRVGVMAPRLLVLPTRLVDNAWDTFEASIAHEAEPAKTQWGTKAVFSGAALGSVGTAAGVFVVIQSGEGLVPALVFSSTFTLFGLLFLWLAVFDV